jgi:hypothetical protein
MDHAKLRGAMIATAVAGLFACAHNEPRPAAPSGDVSATVRCLGVNSCKGQGECKTATHPCGKHTPCKGQGWVTLPSADECASRGGKVI